MPTPTAPPTARRLTHGEIANAISDVLVVDAKRDLHNLSPDLLGQFSNDASTLTVSLEQAQGLKTFASGVANAANLAAYFTCTNFGELCEAGFLSKLGQRLFRRPLNDSQLQNYRKLFAVAQTNGDTFVVGAKLALQVMLQSPWFL